MALRSLYHTLTRPLSPRAEIWTRRALGAGLAMFGSVSVWRNVAIKWWLPWLVMGALGAAVAALLQG